jgi:curved DNA-binding protein CbpA
MSDKKSHYNVLGVNKNDSKKIIKREYRKLVMRWHPDHNKENIELAKEKFIEINLAYKILSDPNLKYKYDNDELDSTLTMIDERELAVCKKFVKSFWKIINLDDVINNFSERDKIVMFNYVSDIYLDKEEFYKDLKEKNIEKLLKKINGGISVYIDNFKNHYYVNYINFAKLIVSLKGIKCATLIALCLLFCVINFIILLFTFFYYQ